jgi:hypothetical protein
MVLGQNPGGRAPTPLDVREVGPLVGERPEAPGAAGLGQRPTAAGKALGWPKRYKLARTFLWEHSFVGLKLAQRLGHLGVFLTCPAGAGTRREGRPCAARPAPPPPIRPRCGQREFHAVGPNCKTRPRLLTQNPYQSAEFCPRLILGQPCAIFVGEWWTALVGRRARGGADAAAAQASRRGTSRAARKPTGEVHRCAGRAVRAGGVDGWSAAPAPPRRAGSGCRCSAGRGRWCCERGARAG